MGEHYCKEEEKTGMIGFWNSFWTNQRQCKFVEECEGMEGSGVWFFRNLHGVGEMPRDLCGGKKGMKIGSGMATRRNSAGAKRRLSHSVAAAAALPLLVE
jgi:omega-6 fatty acid desaturase / acyl-lipid omega-6 desaturase (Delta-12 desaturase)